MEQIINPGMDGGLYYHLTQLFVSVVDISRIQSSFHMMDREEEEEEEGCLKELLKNNGYLVACMHLFLYLTENYDGLLTIQINNVLSRDVRVCTSISCLRRVTTVREIIANKCDNVISS